MDLGASEIREKEYPYVLRHLELGRWFSSLCCMAILGLVFLSQCFIIRRKGGSLTKCCFRVVLPKKYIPQFRQW